MRVIIPRVDTVCSSGETEPMSPSAGQDYAEALGHPGARRNECKKS